MSAIQQAGQGEGQPTLIRMTDLSSALIDAMRDPNVDVGKFGVLMDMYQRATAETARRSFFKAMALAQGEMMPIVRNLQNQSTSSKYADLAAIDDVMRPIYSGHGFHLSFNSAPPEKAGDIRITCRIAHEAGHEEVGFLEAPLDVAGAKGALNKTPVQGLGSTVSYLRRYLTMMIFNVVLTNEDDDGQNLRGQRAQQQATQQQAKADPAAKTEWLKKSSDALAARFNKGPDWLTAAMLCFERAPTQADLDGLVTLQAFNAMWKTAPPEVADQLRAARAAAQERLKPKPVENTWTQPGAAAAWSAPQTQATGQGAAEQRVENPEFLFMLIDGSGDVTGEPYSDPLDWAAAFVDLWREAFPPDRVALAEHNADALEAARADPRASRALATMDEAAPSATTEDHDLTRTIPPPVVRGKTDWVGYRKVIMEKLVLHRDAGAFAAWIELQREHLQAAPIANRALIASSIQSRFRTLGGECPAWVPALMRSSPAAGEVKSDDAIWVDNLIFNIGASSAPDRFNDIITSDDLTRRMQRMQAENPVEFRRADQAITDRRKALQA